MRKEEPLPTLADVKAANPKWFSKKTTRFFGDKRYWVKRGRRTKALYLVRETSGWTDMFGGPPRRFYVINYLNQRTLAVESMVTGRGVLHRRFRDMEKVREWLLRH
jgi:hypothetical protein